MNFFNRSKKLNFMNYLDLTPIHKIDYKVDENEIVIILIPKFSSKFSLKYIIPKLKNPYINLKLDELGSAAWLEIDGNKKVNEIANKLTQKFGEKIQPVEERLTKFLTQLYEHKFITFKEIKGE